MMLSSLHVRISQIEDETNEICFNTSFLYFIIFPFCLFIYLLDGTLQSEYRRSKGSSGILASPLLSFKWKRVILDEAHGIKNPTTLASQSCCAISAQRRWSVTGTPIQNSIKDVYGYLKFLHYEPWCQSNVWKRTITSTNEEDDEEQKNQTIFSRVRRILSPILLRRTKDTLDVDGYVSYGIFDWHLKYLFIFFSFYFVHLVA